MGTCAQTSGQMQVQVASRDEGLLVGELVRSWAALVSFLHEGSWLVFLGALIY